MKETTLTTEHISTLLERYEQAMLVPDNQLISFLVFHDLEYGICHALYKTFRVLTDEKFYIFKPYNIEGELNFWYPPPIWSYKQFGMEGVRNKCLQPRIVKLKHMYNHMNSVNSVD